MRRRADSRGAGRIVTAAGSRDGVGMKGAAGAANALFPGTRGTIRIPGAHRAMRGSR